MKKITVKSSLLFTTAFLGGLLIVNNAAQSTDPVTSTIVGEGVKKATGVEVPNPAGDAAKSLMPAGEAGEGGIPGLGDMEKFVPPEQQKKLDEKIGSERRQQMEALGEMGEGKTPDVGEFVPKEHKEKLPPAAGELFKSIGK